MQATKVFGNFQGLTSFESVLSVLLNLVRVVIHGLGTYKHNFMRIKMLVNHNLSFYYYGAFFGLCRLFMCSIICYHYIWIIRMRLYIGVIALPMYVSYALYESLYSLGGVEKQSGLLGIFLILMAQERSEHTMDLMYLSYLNALIGDMGISLEYAHRVLSHKDAYFISSIRILDIFIYIYSPLVRHFLTKAVLIDVYEVSKYMVRTPPGMQTNK